MLKKWASQLETVHRATTREEREAVYRFRYSVYSEEFGRELGSPDHERQWVTDDDDEKPYTTILYTGTPDRVTGTVRVRHWQAGEVPTYDFDELSMDQVPGVEQLNTAEIGRLMVRQSMRGKIIVASLLRESYQVLAGEYATDLTFCYCSPGLVRYYQQIAMRPFGGRPVAAPDGIMLPMVSVMSDRAYYRAKRSFLTPLVRRFYGPGKNRVLDLEPFLEIFEPDRASIEYEPEKVWHETQSFLLADERPAGAAQAIPATVFEGLARQGLIIDVPVGTLVTRRGFRERELYVVLEGRYELEENSAAKAMERGDLFGEDGYLREDGRRVQSVRCTESGRLLILRGRSMEKMTRREPQLAETLLGYLRELFSQRTAGDEAVAAA